VPHRPPRARNQTNAPAALPLTPFPPGPAAAAPEPHPHDALPPGAAPSVAAGAPPPPPATEQFHRDEALRGDNRVAREHEGQGGAKLPRAPEGVPPLPQTTAPLSQPRPSQPRQSSNPDERARVSSMSPSSVAPAPLLEGNHPEEWSLEEKTAEPTNSKKENEPKGEDNAWTLRASSELTPPPRPSGDQAADVFRADAAAQEQQEIKEEGAGLLLGFFHSTRTRSTSASGGGSSLSPSFTRGAAARSGEGLLLAGTEELLPAAAGGKRSRTASIDYVTTRTDGGPRPTTGVFRKKPRRVRSFGDLRVPGTVTLI